MIFGQIVPEQIADDNQIGGGNMEKWLYVMMIKKGKTYNKVTKAVIERHVENLRKLDAEGKIALCGPFKGYPGVAGMVIFKTADYGGSRSFVQAGASRGRGLCGIHACSAASG